jgi:hypothetical protein
VDRKIGDGSLEGEVRALWLLGHASTVPPATRGFVPSCIAALSTNIASCSAPLCTSGRVIRRELPREPDLDNLGAQHLSNACLSSCWRWERPLHRLLREVWSSSNRSPNGGFSRETERSPSPPITSPR